MRRILEQEGIESALLPPRSPNLNANLERFFKSLSSKCLDDLFRRTVAPNDRDVRYMFGGGDYKMKEYTAWLKFIYQGRTAWETVSSNVPGVISLKQGENVGQKLREFEKPTYAFFEQVELPKFLQKPTQGPGTGPGGSLTLGKSRVTTGGLQ